jgi:hypothetical protein
MSKTKNTAQSTEIKEENLEQFLFNLYNTDINLTDQDLQGWYNEISYKGFNREQVLIELKKILIDITLIIKVIILIAVRGPMMASTIKLPNGRTLTEMGIRGNGGKNTNVLTCGKISAATADLAAFYLKKLNIPKRLPSLQLPGWLQFPAAGSIRMPSNLRSLHLEFSKAFSTQIGGFFNEQIYMQMEINSYLDPKLHLFD